MISAVNICLDHPSLVRTDQESIQAFLRKYDACMTTVLAYAKKLSSNLLNTEAFRPVDIKFSIDAA